MNINNVSITRWVVIVTAALLALSSLRPIADYDTFFLLKTGQLIVQNRGLPTQEVFSWSAAGEPWLIHQPLAQVLFYAITSLTGLAGLAVLTAVIYGLFFISLYACLRAIPGPHKVYPSYSGLQPDRAKKLIRWVYAGTNLSCFSITSLVLALVVAAATWEFFPARAQILGYLLFVLTLAVIFRALFSRPGQIWWTVPIAYLWANSHASFILLPAMLAIYGLVGYLVAPTRRRSILIWFTIVTPLSVLATILPPIGLNGYKVLWEFWRDNQFLRQFINEWAPLETDRPHQLVYYLSAATALGVYATALIRRRDWGRAALALPLIGIVLVSSQSIRHLPFAVAATAIILALCGVTETMSRHRTLALTVCLGLVGLSGYLIVVKREPAMEATRSLPVGATNFLKTHPLQGHMFNDMGFGAYFIYYLYPRYQVFFDGRVEVYHRRQMRDYAALLPYKKARREDLLGAFAQFDRRYDFSYLVVEAGSVNPLEGKLTDRLANILADSPDWSLVYFDDQAQILVKHDGQNESIIRDFGIASIAPYRLQPFKTPDRARARGEISRMLALTTSGRGLTIQGDLFSEAQDYTQAKAAYQKATQVNPDIGMPYLGLGRIAVLEKQLPQARAFYEQALSRNPFLGPAYLELAKIYQSEGNIGQARLLLEQALNYNIDYLSRRDILELSKKLQGQ